MKTIAIILAGGTGSRIGDATPKQFFKIAGKSVIEHTVDAFERCGCVDEIAVVVHPAYVGAVENMVLTNGWRKTKKILCGGNERHESSLAAICAYDDGEEKNLLFHDAVRPLVTQRIISDTAQALAKYTAVGVVVPATDTIVEVDASGSFLQNIPNRNVLRKAQTPQGFRLSVIKKAYDIALRDVNLTATDDCGIVKKYLPEEKIYVVRGEESNMKLTYKEDVYLMDKLFQLQSSQTYVDIDFTGCGVH
jgi:2-C-methyl-D-erythritol 4-phosphate cytidylyltransferase